VAKQSFIWTALPNGWTEDGKSLRVSVLLSPRLEPQGDPQKLSSFAPDWQDWPATLAAATFQISYGGNSVSVPAGSTSGPNRTDAALGSSDSQAWKALFKADLPVKGFEYKDLSGNLVLSFDAKSMASIVRNLYAKLAQNASDRLPVVSDFAGDPDWIHLVSTVAQLDRRFSDEKTGLRAVERHFARYSEDRLSYDDKATETLARFQLFHTPPLKPTPVTHTRQDDSRIKAEWIEYARHEMPKPKDLAEQLDFHQIVAAMNSYPTILRKLGLVVDFILDATAFKQSQDDLLSVSVSFPPGALKITKTNDASPATHAMLSASKFQAVSDPSPQPDDVRLQDRLLDINPNQYDLLQQDVDGAGLKLMNFARSLARVFPEPSQSDAVTKFEKEMGAPALRNAGLMLVHTNRWMMLSGKFAANKGLNAAALDVFEDKPNAMPPSLWAQDILRGFRIDIWDSATARWRSLCERSATYHLGDSAADIKIDREETTVRLAATKSPDDQNKDLVYLHEALVSWTGWSLGAPPPGKAIKPDDGVDPSSAQTSAELPPGIKFKTSFKPVAGSLPRLRYGRRYWIRARAVDLTGNSLLPREKDFGQENPEKNARLYCRYDPIAAPIIALVRPKGGPTEKPAGGESMERIAIRSFNNTQADNAIPTGQVARRFAVPPQSSVREAELHGMLDDPAGKLDKSKFNILANQKDLDATDPNAALQLEIIPTKGPLDPAPVDTTYATYRDGHTLTYLPDPMAEEVSARIFDHPGIADTEIITIPLYPKGKWPDAQPFKIRLFEETGSSPKFDTATNTLLIPLPKAVRAKVRLSMRPSKDSLSKMGIWNWIASPNDLLEKLALGGQHWMLTPWRTLEVVHAVQKPLIAPEMSKLTVQRAYSWTGARPAFVATCSIKSTDRLDLLSEWHEPRDDPAGDSEEIQIDLARGDPAFSIKVVDPKSYALKILGHQHGGFADHMTIGEDLISVNIIGHDFALSKTHEFHDTRYRRIEYWLEATTRFREYMPASILTETVGNQTLPTEKNIKVVGPKSVTWVPSSAPPPAPNVLYVVPTFGWVRITDDKGNKYSMRRGRGLRVYLDRPWNVSGYGEMLAVLLAPPSFAGNPEQEPKGHPYKNCVTQWGNDPIWLSPFVSWISPKRSDFPLARTAADSEGKWLPKDAPASEKDQPPGPFAVTGLSLPGMSSYSNTYAVEIAPHDVFYDEGRRLWYCDIEIDSGSSYYPFVRLALARYQPVSVPGAHLSNPVLADFMPLAADRWMNVTHTSNEQGRRITIYGPSYTDSSGHVEAEHSPSMSMFDPLTRKVRTLAPADVSATSVFEVWLEKLDATLGEDFGWQRVPGVVAKPVPKKKIKTAPRQLYKTAYAGELIRKRKFDVLVKEGLLDPVFMIQPLFDGEIALPMAQGDRYRLVIAEYEEYLVDDDRPYDKVPEKKGKRLVFVEHIELE
jgi:hypothetical protein